jgi:hypothetical protein
VRSLNQTERKSAGCWTDWANICGKMGRLGEHLRDIGQSRTSSYGIRLARRSVDSWTFESNQMQMHVHVHVPRLRGHIDELHHQLQEQEGLAKPKKSVGGSHIPTMTKALVWVAHVGAMVKALCSNLKRRTCTHK